MVFHIQQEKFEGPLELLVELIENEKLSISEISLAKVADGYITHVHSLEKIDPEQLAEFLVVAAQLMLIKSRSLLPGLKLSEEEEASIEELETRLAEYQKIRTLTKELKQLEARKMHSITREASYGTESIFYPPPKLTVSLLEKVYEAILTAIPKVEKLAQDKIRRIISLEEKISHIRSSLQGSIERGFSDIIKGAKEKVDVIVSFLAILELAKQKFVELHQQKPFEDIVIKRL